MISMISIDIRKISMISIDAQVLLKRLRKGKRFEAWSALIPLLPPRSEVSKLLNVYVNELKAFRKQPKRPRFTIPAKHSYRACKGCNQLLGPDHNIRKHMHSITSRYWVKRWWATKGADIEQRRQRTAKARETRIRMRWEPRLRDVPPRLRKLLGDDECIRRLRNDIPIGLS